VESEPIISAASSWSEWLCSPPGRYLLQWEQEQFDAAVADLFGYFALQCGTPQLDCLRANRMPSKVCALLHEEHTPKIDAREAGVRSALRLAAFEELPFESHSIDLVVLPHVLESCADPHQALREVERVLRPEGRLIVTGLNPVSLWGARQFLARGRIPAFVPDREALLGLPRLRDWLKLLGFELERGRYGCFRPPCTTQSWLDRTRFLESAGDRWWPICGAVYMLSAVKRVQGMRLVGKLWKSPRAKARARPATASKAPADQSGNLARRVTGVGGDGSSLDRRR